MLGILTYNFTISIVLEADISGFPAALTTLGGIGHNFRCKQLDIDNGGQSAFHRSGIYGPLEQQFDFLFRELGVYQGN